MKYPRCFICEKPIRKNMVRIETCDLKQTGNYKGRVFYWRVLTKWCLHKLCYLKREVVKVKQAIIALFIIMLTIQVADARDIGNVRGFGADTPERVSVGENYEQLKIGMTEYDVFLLLGEPYTTKTSITEEGVVKVNTYIGVEPCREVRGWWVIEVKLFLEEGKLIRIEIKDI